MTYIPPYDNPQMLKEYTWSAGEFTIKVKRLEQDRQISPDLAECQQQGMTVEQYDKVVRQWACCTNNDEKGSATSLRSRQGWQCLQSDG